MSYDLHKAAVHIVHDYAWLVAAGTDTQKGLANPFNHYAERTFLVHARAFSDFFSTKANPNDMYARDFVLSRYAAKVRAWNKWHDHLNQHLMHLSKQRIKNTRPWTGADNKMILEGFQAAWNDFYSKLKPSVKPSFDRELANIRGQF